MRFALPPGCAALAMAATITLSAQTPTSAPRPPAPAPAPSTPTMSNHHAGEPSVTVTGCLKAWDSTMGSAPATPPATGATAFVLTNVEGDAAASPTTTPTAAPALPAQYVLTADASVNLTAHLNHKVRIVGTKAMADAPAAMTHSADAAKKPADPMAKPDQPMTKPGMGKDMATAMGKEWSTLHATSVTMIAATCPAVSQ